MNTQYDGPFILKIKLDTNKTRTFKFCENSMLLKKQSLEVLKPGDFE
jgi:hypothetical protein